MAIDRRQATGIAGGTLTLIVVGLLVGLHLAGKPEVPRHARPLPLGRNVYLCSTVPAWVVKALPEAQKFWSAHGADYGDVIQDPHCAPTCKAPDGRPMVCHTGGITIDLRDQGFSDDHLGETTGAYPDGKLQWATILLPSEVPKGMEALVLAHELGHAEGYDHSQTKIIGGAISHKTGEIMHPSAAQLGWGAAGLP